MPLRLVGPDTSSEMTSVVRGKHFTWRSMCLFTSTFILSCGTFEDMSVCPSPQRPYVPMSMNATSGRPS